MSDAFISLDELEWQTVKIHRQGETRNYDYQLELFKPLADWDVWAVWERERIASMQKHIKQGDVLIDVGAEQGWMSALFSKYMTENIILVEPTAEFWPGIRAIFEKNGLEKPVTCFQGFLSNETCLHGRYDFQVPYEWELIAYDSKVIEKRKYRNVFDSDDQDTIRSVRLDEAHYLPVGIEKANHISIDVEGAELQVLLGAEQTLRKHKPLVWCSVHPDMMERDYKQTKEDLLFFMDDCGYDGELLTVDHEEHWFFTPKETT